MLDILMLYEKRKDLNVQKLSWENKMLGTKDQKKPLEQNDTSFY